MIGVLGISWHAIKRWYYRRFHRLSATVFSPDSVRSHDIQDFDCGRLPWEVYVADWLKNGGASADIADPKRQTRVWLFWYWKGLVGFGSLGKTRRPIPAPHGPFLDAVIIPFFGVHWIYQGRPRRADRDERYAGQIMNHLIHHAREYGLQYLCLYVDPENERAKAFYRKFGFAFMGMGNNGMDVMAIRFF